MNVVQWWKQDSNLRPSVTSFWTYLLPPLANALTTELQVHNNVRTSQQARV